MESRAVYFDGETAHDRAVGIRTDRDHVVFSGPGVAETRWPIKGLHPIDTPTEGQPFRITHDDKPGARIVLRDEDFIHHLLSMRKELRGGLGWAHLRQVAGWTIAGFIALFALGWLMLTFLPQKVAYVLPDEWRNRIGSQVVQSLVGDARICHSSDGDSAKSALIAMLSEGTPDLPPIAMEIYDIPVMNAFAAPGGKIIFTRKILEEAGGPDEIAGVLAHEIGHVAYRHPEAQLLRLTGLQVLISVATGTNGGDLTSNVGALVALLRYSREAEREADGYARSMLEGASIDPQGLKRFFEKILVLEKGDDAKKPELRTNDEPTVMDRVGNVFSTHPGTEERIKELGPLPAGKSPIPSLDVRQWKSLQEICKG